MKGDVAFMATMILDLDPRMIENDGERRVYAALKGLPGDYTVQSALRRRLEEEGSEVS
jgi:hypothetical protein